MENSKLNIVGIGCDFQLEADDSPRKLAIEVLLAMKEIELSG